MSDSIKTVELHSAAFFICEECGRDNFVRLTTSPSTREEKEEVIRKMIGIPDDEEVDPELDGEFVRPPDQVTCSHCKTEFQTDIRLGEKIE